LSAERGCVLLSEQLHNDNMVDTSFMPPAIMSVIDVACLSVQSIVVD
jgi:hypothetical protein